MLRIALVTGVAGLVILFLMSSNIEVDERAIDKINKDNVGEQVKLNGMVERVNHVGEVTFVEIVQPSKMTVVVFNERNLSLSEGEYVEIIGKIDEYEGSMEVLAQRIRKVR